MRRDSESILSEEPLNLIQHVVFAILMSENGDDWQYNDRAALTNDVEDMADL